MLQKWTDFSEYVGSYKGEKFRNRPDPDPHIAANRFVSKSYPLTGRRMICPYAPPVKYDAYTDLSRNTVTQTHPMFTKTQKRDKKEKA